MTHRPVWDDLSIFVDPDDFAVEGRITLSDGSTRTVNGIFDWPGVQAELGDYQQDDLMPQFMAIATDLVGIKRGDLIMIDGQLFDILAQPQPDGTGMAVLLLAKP